MKIHHLLNVFLTIFLQDIGQVCDYFCSNWYYPWKKEILIISIQIVQTLPYNSCRKIFVNSVLVDAKISSNMFRSLASYENCMSISRTHYIQGRRGRGLIIKNLKNWKLKEWSKFSQCSNRILNVDKIFAGHLLEWTLKGDWVKCW